EAQVIERGTGRATAAVGPLLRVREGVQHTLDDAGLAADVKRRAQVAGRKHPPDTDAVADGKGGAHACCASRSSISASLRPSSSGVRMPLRSSVLVIELIQRS